jgi:hypothetical protein
MARPHSVNKAPAGLVIALLALSAFTVGLSLTSPVRAASGGSAWSRFVADSPASLAGDCFIVTSGTQWTQTPCSKGVIMPVIPITVGNGVDKIARAQGSNLINSSVGSFPITSGISSEKDSLANLNNAYTFQDNSNTFFATTIYTGGITVEGWEQYVFVNDPPTNQGYVFIQYWLLGYLTLHPTGCPATSPPGGTAWFKFGNDCYGNGAAQSTPFEPITNIGNLRLESIANMSDYDVTALCVGATCYTTLETSAILDLYQSWTDSEFNIIGYGGGSQAVFNSGVSITVQQVLNTPPNCADGGTTGETNNLNLRFCSTNGNTLDFTETNVASVSQPITATFIGGNGGSQQDLTVNGCYPSPAFILGDGSQHAVTMDQDCAFSLSLPPGYLFAGGNGTTTCMGGTCNGYSTSYEAVGVPVTQPVTASFNAADGGTEQNVTVTGCGATPTLILGDGSPHDVTMTSNCPFSLTLPPNYKFTGGNGTTSCASGTCSDYSTTYSSTSPVGIVCAPTPVVVGTKTTCTATVRGAPTPTGKVEWFTTGSGAFNPITCHLALGSCHTTYKPLLSNSPVTIVASYMGDKHNHAANNTFILVVRPTPSTTSVMCAPLTAKAGSSTVITCKGKVTGFFPGGTITWYQSGSGSVSFTSNVCNISGTGCSVTMTGVTAGSVLVNGVYGGDPNNLGSNGNQMLTILQARPKLAVSCTPTPYTVGTNTTCTATLTGFAGTVTGESITWAALGAGTVSFSATTCGLNSGGVCSVNATGTKAGMVTIAAGYSGDSNNLGKTKTTTVKVQKSATTVLLSCIPGSIAKGSSTTCTATVSGYSPSGLVVFSKMSGPGKVKFLSPTCTLTGGTCNVSVMGTGVGSVTIKAVYIGDGNNASNSNTFIETVT